MRSILCVGIAGLVVSAVPHPSLAQGTCALIPSDAVGWWPGNGDATDKIGSSDGYLDGDVRFAPAQVGQGFSFGGNGNQGVVDLHNPSALQVSAGDFTAEAWVKFDSLGGDMSILDKMNLQVAVNDDGWRLLKQADNRFWFCIGSARGVNNCVGRLRSATVAAVGQWYHVAAVLKRSTSSSTTLSIFVNGMLEGTSQDAAIYDTNAARMLIGANGYQRAPLKGMVDEPAIYSRALTAAEIKSIYDAGSAGKCKNHVPIANAGLDQTLECTSSDPLASASAVLRADGSSDPDGDPLTYQWLDEIDRPIGTSVDVTVGAPYGKHMYSVVVDDGRGGSSTASTNVTVQDTTKPSMICPADMSAECSGNSAAMVTPGAASASDSCGLATSTSYSAASFPLGTTTLTYRAFDRAGNSSECSSTITVADTTPPAIDCPPSVRRECTGNGVAPVDPGSATATDVCTSAIVSGPGPEDYPLGTNVLTYSATDQSGNRSTCYTTVEIVDTTRPSISCPAPVTAQCTGDGRATVDPGSATATDTCTFATVSGPGVDQYLLGTTSLTYEAKDRSGNTSSCNTHVDVIDNIAPTIVCPNAIVAECTGGASAPVTPGAAAASDSCTPVTVNGFAKAQYPLGTTVLTYSAADRSGNRSDCTSDISVVDTTAPSITCPAAVVAECTGNRAAMVDPGPASADDLCTPVTIAGPPSDLYPLGTTVTQYSATDQSGNRSSCVSHVEVVDTTAPNVTCPAAITAECTGDASAIVTPGTATATDACSSATVTVLPAQSYPLGTNPVSHTAFDESGNKSSCTSTIAVVDTTPPAFDASSLGDRILVGSCAATPVAFVAPSASDSCTSAHVTCDALPGNSFGANTVACRAVDRSGNATTANLQVKVLQPLHVVFRPPLADDNVADDVDTDADVNNLFKSGWVVLHSVRLYDCAEKDVTSTVPVTVKLLVSRGANGEGGAFVNEIDEIPGIGDEGGLMVLIAGAYRFLLLTNPVDYPPGGHIFRSLVTASYTAVPDLVVGAEDARLVSK